MLRRAWRVASTALGGPCLASVHPPCHPPDASLCVKPWLSSWTVPRQASSRSDSDDKAKRRAVRRAARRDLNEWRGADVTLKQLRELRELRPHGGSAAPNNGSNSSKRRWARDWASSLGSDDVGDGQSYESFVAQALQHAGDPRYGPGSGPRQPKQQGTGSTRGGPKKEKKETSVKYKHRRGGSSSNPKKNQRSPFQMSKRWEEDDFFSDFSYTEGDAYHGTRRSGKRNNRNTRNNRYGHLDSGEDSDAFWAAFERAMRRDGFNEFSGFGGFDGFYEGYQQTSYRSNSSHSTEFKETSLPSCPFRATLGIEPGAELDEKGLKLALRQSAMKWHPDRHPSIDKPNAEVEFKKCYDAYEALSNRIG